MMIPAYTITGFMVNMKQEEPGSCDACGGMTLFTQDYLFAPVDLTEVELSGLSTSVRITGFKERNRTVSFAVSPEALVPAASDAEHEHHHMTDS